MNLLKYTVITATILVTFGVIRSGWIHYHPEDEVLATQTHTISNEDLSSSMDETESIPVAETGQSEEMLTTAYEAELLSVPEPTSIENTDLSTFETSDDIMLYIDKLNDSASDSDLPQQQMKTLPTYSLPF